MAIKLRPWTHPGTGDVRIYVSGTNRDHNKLHIRRRDDGGFSLHSVNLDTPASRLAGDVYGKRDKDSEAILDALTGFGFARKTPFNDVLAAAEGRAPLTEILPP